MKQKTGTMVPTDPIITQFSLNLHMLIIIKKIKEDERKMSFQSEPLVMNRPDHIGGLSLSPISNQIDIEFERLIVYGGRPLSRGCQAVI